MPIALSGSHGRPLFLASVTSAEEAAIALGAGADIIDAKDPAAGALGALPAEALRAIVAKVAGRKPVSATIGDGPMPAAALVAAIEATAATGVNVIKIGFASGPDTKDAIAATGMGKRGKAALVGVLMADRDPDFELIGDLAAAGYAGVMLDTEDKAAGSLLTVMPAARCGAFLSEVRRHGMFAGFAGSIKAQQIGALQAIRPDVLGFRGALCRKGLRGERLDGFAVAAVAHAIATAFPETGASRPRLVAGVSR